MASRSEATSLVGGFLMFQQNQDFCDVCVSERTTIPVNAVRAAAEKLSKTSGFIRDRWTCDRCHTQTVVTRAVGNPVVAFRSRLRLNRPA